jgi:hypothetical protein
MDSARAEVLTMPPSGKRSGTEEWARIRRITRWGNTQKVRRLVVLLWIAVLALDPWVVMQLSRSFYALARLPRLLLPTLTQLLVTWIAFRAMQIGLAQPPLTDSAVMRFGAEFEELTETEREELMRARSRELLLGKLQRDEREAELQARAERESYRLLRRGLAMLVAVYWGVCLFGPFGGVRPTLVLTAIGFTWLAVAVLGLPTMVRMWTQPNEVGESRIARSGKQDQ